MNKWISSFSLWVAGWMIGVGALAHAGNLSAKEIMVQNEEARKVEDVFSNAVLTTGGRGSGEKVKRFTWWKKLTSNRVHYNTLTRFHQPAEVRGEGILFLEHEQDDNEVLMYLPNFKKIRRVENQAQSGSFMGSEFSYSDIATPHVEDYQYKLLAEESCVTPESTTGGCYKIQSTPVSDAIRERTGHGRAVHWVRKDNFMVVKSDYYDLEDKHWKKMEASEIKMVDSVKKKWMAHRIRIENLGSGRFTRLEFSDVKANAGIKDSVFSQQNLSRP